VDGMNADVALGLPKSEAPTRRAAASEDAGVNLAENLRRTAERFPERVALRIGDRHLTYSQFDELASRAAGFMADMGVTCGDRVGLMVPNMFEFPVLFYGAARLGAVVVPMNPLLKGREISHYTEDSGMVLLWAHESVAAADLEDAASGCRVERVGSGLLNEVGYAKVVPAAHRGESDTAVILYTSGTTGVPKGAELTHGGLNRNLRASIDEIMSLTEDDVVLGCLPLFHVFGLTCGLNASVAAGAELVLVARFDAAQVLTAIGAHRVTIFLGVPTMYIALANLPGVDARSAATLRICASGGASLPAEVMREFERRFGAVIVEGYGLSETSPTASTNVVGRSRVGSIGMPISGVEFKLVSPDGRECGVGEVGEICIRGHNVMKGYWGRPEATAAAIDSEGWFHSGDLGKVDEDGFYYIVDRMKDLIIRGGYNVYPREIEEVLYEHPAVREVAVVGLPHAVHGEEVGAAVSLRSGASATTDELREYVKARVAPYKYPRLIWILDSLPTGGTGKILKRAIELPTDIS